MSKYYYNNHRNRKKVKRYKRSYYSPTMKVRRVVGIIALVAVVLAAAWFAAPHVINWATHTWYTVVKNRDLEAESGAASASSAAAASEAAASSAAAVAAATPAPTATPEPEVGSGTAIVDGNWAEVSVSQLKDEASIRAAAQSLASQGAAYAVVTLKDTAGAVYYASGVEAASGSIADTTIDAALVAKIFKENGLVPVAQLCAFRDDTAAHSNRSMAILYNSSSGSTYLWLDAKNAAAGGKAWLNPYSAEAAGYIGDLIAEVHGLGFDHVALRCVQFPTAVSSKQDFGSTGGTSRQTQLAADIAEWQKRFNGAVTLWLRYSYSECTTASAQLGAPAVELGMQNLLVDTGGKPLTAEERAALTDAAAAAGVANTMIEESF